MFQADWDTVGHVADAEDSKLHALLLAEAIRIFGEAAPRVLKVPQLPAFQSISKHFKGFLPGHKKVSLVTSRALPTISK